jgi:PQQ-dependent dehydrogenase (methanol/ethanol family)
MSMRSRWVRGVLLGVVALGWSVAAQERPRPFVPVSDEMLMKPNPADWLMWRRTQDSHGFSPLAQVDRSNVGQLRLVWSRTLASGRGEATPLIYDGVMYLPNPSDLIQAFDAATGDMRWEHRRTLPKDLRRSNDGNRNIAIYGTNIIDATSDNQIVALDARTGTLVWETKVLDHTLRATTSAGPIIANGKVIAGRNCQPDAGGSSCIITAHDAVTGKELWRTRTIAMPGEPGGDTWGDVPAELRVHAGAWMVPSYDPETNLIFMGTSVTSPAPKFTLGGNDKQYLYHNSTLALDADTGKIVWHYQHIVDHWDLDHPFERLLVETAVRPDPREVPWINPRLRPGERRKVITGIPGKTGVIYTLDRRTGEFLWARPTSPQNVVAKIDGATGQVTVNPETLFTAVGQERMVCPGMNGGKNFQAGAYSPQTNAMYYGLQSLCMMATAVIDKPDPTNVYGISSKSIMAPGTTNVGTVWAVSAETGRMLWKHEQRAGVLSVVATAGGLIFAGDTNGRFKALDDRSGKVLWETNLGAPVGGYPIAFSANGKQYLAISTGVSNVGTAANRMTPELKPGTGSNLFVFALP